MTKASKPADPSPATATIGQIVSAYLETYDLELALLSLGYDPGQVKAQATRRMRDARFQTALLRALLSIRLLTLARVSREGDSSAALKASEELLAEHTRLLAKYRPPEDATPNAPENKESW